MMHALMHDPRALGLAITLLLVLWCAIDIIKVSKRER